METEKKPSKVAMKTDKSRKKIDITSFRKQLDQYLSSASLHGLRYVGDRSITWFERSFFLFALILALYLSGSFISIIITNWATSTLATMGSEAMPLSTLPFPALTVCNSNLVKKSLVTKVPLNTRSYNIIQSFCNIGHMPIDLDETWYDSYHATQNVSQTCTEMIPYCSYGALPSDCSRIFLPLLSDSGHCCTFNAIPDFELYNGHFEGYFQGEEMSSHWHPDHDFLSTERLKNPYSFPRPIKDSGDTLGLTMLLYADNKEKYCASALTNGFRIHLYAPYNHPRIYEFGELIPKAYVSQIVVDPYTLQADESVRRMSMKYRNCYFQDENPLQFYRAYSESNCQLECLLNATYKNCNCVQYYMPPFLPNATICGSRHLACIGRLLIVGSSVLNEEFQCGCLPTCSSLSYTVSVSASPIKKHVRSIIPPEYSLDDVAVVKVFFTTRLIRRFFRRESATFTETLASIGGILGFFLGFSLVSVAELFYFVFIRPHCIARRIPNAIRNGGNVENNNST